MRKCELINTKQEGKKEKVVASSYYLAHVAAILKRYYKSQQQHQESLDYIPFGAKIPGALRQ